jgi:hypothetical protein
MPRREDWSRICESGQRFTKCRTILIREFFLPLLEGDCGGTLKTVDRQEHGAIEMFIPYECKNFVC